MHRTATFYDLKLTAYGMSRPGGRSGAQFETDPKSMSEIFEDIKQLFEGGDRIVKKGRSDKTPKTYLSDIHQLDDKFVLLVNRSDPGAPDAVSSEPDTKSRVVHNKPPGHGGDFSAHVIIEMQPSKGDNYYVCVIETVYGSGLHASSIGDYVKHLVRACKNQFPERYKAPDLTGAKNPDGTPVLVDLNHSVDFQGHPSEDFQKDLENGRLSSIQVINFSHEGGVWDDKGSIKESYRAIELRPEKSLKSSVTQTITQIRNQITKHNKDYDHIRIKFKNESGESRDATISVQSGSLINKDKYIKRHIIEAPLVNTNSFEQVNRFIIKEVLKLME